MASLDRNKWLLLGSSVGVLVLLVVAALRENVWLEWRQVQAEVTVDGDAIPVMLRQVVNPSLGVADRCVSCHVSMAPGEQSAQGPAQTPHPAVVHDPAEYGCTVCHGGQGRATTKADAHGAVPFWPEPMLPVGSTQAGCGTCHAASGVPTRPVFDQWAATFERLDCRACHRVDGRGGTIRPDGGGLEGPDLSRVGLAGFNPDWYDAHVARAAAATDAPWRKSWGEVSETDRALVERYLHTRVGAPQVISAKSTFLASGCLGCHKVSGVGGDDGPDLTRVGEKDPGRADFTAVPGDRSLAAWFDQHVRTPSTVVVGSQMPAMRLTSGEVDDLTLFTLSLRRRDVPGSHLPRDRMQVARFGEREFASDGATLYGAFCAGCHGKDGLGLRAAGVATFPSVANPDFLAVAPDALIAETIRRGRPGRRMRAWSDASIGLRESDVPQLVAHLRTMAGTPAPADPRPARWVAGNVETGRRLFERTCSGCHGAEGQGVDAPALNNAVLLAAGTDTYFTETIARGRRGTAMVGFAEPSPTHPTLTRAEIESIVTFIRTWGGQP
ncbi:MAG: c-type cytochrome [Acidobacteria bacterium]|nr:c-type cytochrome [Acidobacteriota bacterium]